MTYRAFEQSLANTPGIFEGLDPHGDLVGMYERLGIPSDQGQSRDSVIAALKDKLSQLHQENRNEDGINLTIWQRIGVIDSVLLNGGEPTPGYMAVSALQDQGLRLSRKCTEDAWRETVRLAKGLKQVYVSDSPGHMDRLFPEVKLQARAIVMLRKLGCRVDYEGENIVVEDGGKKVITMMEKVIRQYGGIAFIRKIFKSLKPGYNPVAKRYLIFQSLEWDSSENIQVTPWGYLLNLAAKYIHIPTKAPVPLPIILQVEELAQALLLLTGTQPFTPIELLVFHLDQLPNIASGRAFFDASFRFAQADMADEVSDMERLFGWVDDEAFRARTGFTLADYMAVCKAITKLCYEKFGPIMINRQSINQQLPKPVSETSLSAILDVLCHPFGQVNQHFCLMTDHVLAQVHRKPLCAAKPGPNNLTYWILDAHWVGGSFYDVLYELCAPFNDAIRHIGSALEGIVFDLFVEKGFDAKRGKYKYVHKKPDPFRNKQLEGDSDLAIEIGNNLFLLETKKTQLTRLAQSGKDYHVFADLAGALIKAQEQAGKIEIILREQGFMRLEHEDSEQQYTLQYSGGRIERIAVSQYDFDTFQDHAFTQRLLELLLNIELKIKAHIDAPKNVVDIFEKLNKMLAKLTDQYNWLCTLREGFNDRPYFDSWFMSLPFLRFALSMVPDPEEFAEAIRRFKHATFGTGNIYQEFIISRRLDTRQKA